MGAPEMYLVGFNDGLNAAVDILMDNGKQEALDILYSLTDAETDED